MIDIPVYDAQGKQVGSVKVDEKLLGGEVNPVLLKLAFNRYHANLRLGTSKTKGRGEIEGSTRKLFKQKHTGGARRGAIRTNIMKGGGRGHAKVPHSWRKDMPDKMRRLANRNAVLAKAVDGEIKLVDTLKFDKPSTKKFQDILEALKVNRSALVALADTRSHEARSAANLNSVHLTRIDQINVFNLLNNRFLVAERSAFQGWLDKAIVGVKPAKTEAN
ncbi:MAG: 50S ribosomal protein L4 [Planctomycetes bacterium]|nr:50S ribosomal protein L4 [Planctomycetota bacterium]